MNKTGYRVLLRDNKTGEEQWISYDSQWDDAADFLWTEGNNACDCSRHVLFEEAAGRKPNDDRPCGSVRYIALHAELPDGATHALDSEAEG